ncbi:MurR/RpiR family transcriptional regulator [Bacillus testis]|uniref:MurR/RpiR family transcriptional regulator n=1 Tax=Bacillus testis TaxID=1622072 RepID=UPI00067EB0F7|nr:MurR/RpiR family transcriptional regulator [Bacillus testis]
MSDLSLLSKIKNKRSSLTEAEKKVADYVLNQPEYIPTMTTKELAQQADASEASVIRFCKSIGIRSFKLLKVQLAKEQNQSDGNINDFSLIHSNDTSSSLFHKVTYFNKSAIEQTLHTLDRKELDEAVAKMLKANTIAFFGVGGSYAPAVDAQYKLMKLGFHAQASADFHYMVAAVTMMKESDVLVLISTSGKTKEVVELAHYAKSRKVTVIAITTLQKSPLLALSDIALCTPHVEEEHRIGTIASRMTHLNIIDTLYLSIFRLMDQKIVDLLNQSREKIIEQRK